MKIVMLIQNQKDWSELKQIINQYYYIMDQNGQILEMTIKNEIFIWLQMKVQ